MCGKHGCFEAHASAQGLVRHFQRLGGTAANAEEVVDKMRAGNASALAGK